MFANFWRLTYLSPFFKDTDVRPFHLLLMPLEKVVINNFYIFKLQNTKVKTIRKRWNGDTVIKHFTFKIRLLIPLGEITVKSSKKKTAFCIVAFPEDSINIMSHSLMCSMSKNLELKEITRI